MTREYRKQIGTCQNIPKRLEKKIHPLKAQKRAERSQDELADASGTRTHAQSARIDKVTAEKNSRRRQHNSEQGKTAELTY